MRHLKIAMLVVASLALPVLMAVAGCDNDHGNHYYHGDRDHSTANYYRQDNDRHEERQDSDWHDDRGGDSAHEGEHGNRQ